MLTISRPLLASVVLSCACATSCGNPALVSVDTQSAAVAGGQLDEQTTQVFRVLARIDGFSELCSATLISPRLMLTARHCVAPTPALAVDCAKDTFGQTIAPDNLKFSNDTEPDLFSRWFSASAVLVSDESNNTCGYDIAVVVLSEDVPEAIATPATPRFAPAIERGEVYSAVGYGASDTNERLAEFGIRHSKNDLLVNCSPGEVCDGSATTQEFVGSTGACSGDSGGPALDDHGRVIGVLSRGAEGCQSPVYTGVPAFEALLLLAADQAAQAGAALPVWAGGDAPADAVDNGTSDTTAVPESNTKTPQDAGATSDESSDQTTAFRLNESAGCSVEHAGSTSGRLWAFMLAAWVVGLGRRRLAR